MAIGMHQWEFIVHGIPTDLFWRYLVDKIGGKDDVRWDLSPDYQRGPVWSRQQQERFIGHVLSGGQAPFGLRSEI
jgi:hypothetical protein